MHSSPVLGLTATALALVFTLPTVARAENPSALTGIVSSAAEGAMEGVVVTAHKDGSIVSTSVTTDAKGRYAFPENRPLHARRPRRRLRPCRAERCRRRRREDRDRRHQA